MTHRGAEIIVPIRAVYPVAFIKIHGIGDIWQVVSRPRHGSGIQLDVDLVLASNGRMGPGAG